MRQTFLTILKQHISQKRFDHSIRVEETALALCKSHNRDTELISKACILHDIAKNHTPDSFEKLGLDGRHLNQCWEVYPAVWHAFAGPLLIELEFPGQSEPIYGPVQLHTTGNKDMTLDEAIVFIADYTEPGRDDDGHRASILSTAHANLEKAIAMITHKTIQKLHHKKAMIHPFTLSCWEWYSPFLDEEIR
jgi:predicted HD superfamily hydrolase involved in NAD metabolism